MTVRQAGTAKQNGSSRKLKKARTMTELPEARGRWHSVPAKPRTVGLGPT